MKRLIIVMACAVIAITISQNAAGQSATANVTVDVQSTLQITNLAGNQTLDFGSVSPGANVDIPAASGVDFRISGASTVGVQVTYTAPTVLQGPGSDIPFEAEFIGSDTDNPAGATALTSGDTPTLNSAGQYFLWLGGDIEVGNILPGTYSGVFNISVLYP
jgi:hypothetical protein